MKKYMDKLSKNIHVNKNLFVFLLIILLVGVTSGAVFATILDSNDKQLVLNYLNDFFNNVKNDKLAYNTSLVNTLIFTVGFAILIWILGISVIGFFLVLFMLFIKAFVLGFSLSSIIINYKLKGLLLGLLYVFPHQIINVLVFIMLCAYSLILSFKIICCFNGKKSLNFKNIINRYIIVLLISIVVLIITSLYETFIMPYILNFVLELLK